jgi:hypothetical protein
MKNNINALDEINKGCTMGIQAINNLMDKISSQDFKDELNKQLKNYDKIEDKIQDVYNKYSSDEPHEVGPMAKVMSDWMMNMQTIMDPTDSKIAELLMQGTNMGIIEGRKIINNKNINDDIKDLIEDFITMQEKDVEYLKKYL